MTKCLTVFLSFTLIISFAVQWMAHAEEEHIYYSDLFYGYDSEYLESAKLQKHYGEVSGQMAKVFNEYIDSPAFTWTGIKTSISAATDFETFLKLLTDAYGDEHGATYYDGMDAANADFVKEMMGQTRLSEAEAYYGKCGKISKKAKDLLK